MRIALFLLIFANLFASCASIINAPYQVVQVYTPSSGYVVLKEDSLKSNKQEPAIFAVRRSKEPLHFRFSNDTTSKDLTIHHRNSFAWFANIFCNYGIGMLVDYNNPKRYGYPGKVFLDKETRLASKAYKYHNKGTWLIHFSLPHINIFELRPQGEGTKYNTGFLGISAGLDYYHSKKQYLSLTGNAVMDFMVPAPAPVRYEGPHEQMYSTYLALTNNHKIRRFSLGYGLAYGNNLWRFGDRSTGGVEIKSNTFLGFSAPIYFQIVRTFHLGFIYRPSFLNLNTNELQYEHLMSVDFAWKFVWD
jgi:hypothetical protein